MFNIKFDDNDIYNQFLLKYLPNQSNRTKFKNLLTYITKQKFQPHNKIKDYKEIVALESVKYNDLNMILGWCGIDNVFFNKPIIVQNKNLSKHSS